MVVFYSCSSRWCTCFFAWLSGGGKSGGESSSSHTKSSWSGLAMQMFVHKTSYSYLVSLHARLKKNTSQCILHLCDFSDVNHLWSCWCRARYVSVVLEGGEGTVQLWGCQHGTCCRMPTQSSSTVPVSCGQMLLLATLPPTETPEQSLQIYKYNYAKVKNGYNIQGMNLLV